MGFLLDLFERTLAERRAAKAAAAATGINHKPTTHGRDRTGSAAREMDTTPSPSSVDVSAPVRSPPRTGIDRSVPRGERDDDDEEGWL